MDVIFKEGMLYLLGVKFGKKTWKKTWMVLFQPSNSGIGRLEMYDLNTCHSSSDIVSHQMMSVQQKRAERKVVRLCDCTSVTPAPEEACPRGCTALYLHTTLRTYTLASESCQDWFSALCQVAFQDPRDTDKRTQKSRGDTKLSMEDNVLYSSWKEDVTLAPGQYQVMVQSTEASRRCQLSGQYVFGTDQKAAMLLNPLTGLVLYHWPYRFLRRFGPVKGGFSFEAGHRCDSGEGLFTFLSPNAVQIYQAIARHCAAKDKTASSPSSSNPNKRLFYENAPEARSTTVLPPNKTNSSRADPPPGSGPRADEPLTPYYSTIEEIGTHAALDRRKSSLPELQNSPHFTAPVSGGSTKEDWEVDNVGDDGDERCDSTNSIISLNFLKMDSLDKDSDYYNLRASPQPPMQQQQDLTQAQRDALYSVVSFPDGGDQSKPPQQQQQQAVPSGPVGPAKPQRQPRYRYQQQNQDQDQYHMVQQHQQQTHPYPPPLGADHTKEAEEGEEEAVMASSNVNPCRVISVSFKQKLSQLISKDLAKLQPAPTLTYGGVDPSLLPHY